MLLDGYKFNQLLQDSWDELKLHFQLPKQKNNCYTAEMLLSMYNDERNRLYLVYLHSLLEEVEVAVKTFEAENADRTNLLTTLLHLLNSI